jgi:hypothetical protein
MRPPDGKPTRRGMRRARRGMPTGRRATHAVQTTYGRHQRDRDWRETMCAAIEAFRQQRGQAGGNRP